MTNRRWVWIVLGMALELVLFLHLAGCFSSVDDCNASYSCVPAGSDAGDARADAGDAADGDDSGDGDIEDGGDGDAGDDHAGDDDANDGDANDADANDDADVER